MIFYIIHKGTELAVAKVDATDARDAELRIPDVADALDYADYDLMVEARDEQSKR